jgi:Lon protease-like protein
MAIHHLDIPPDFREEVRLFPLSNLVMFPGNLLPLHIFESRYVEMLEDALSGDQLVAMATLAPGHEHDYYSRPPVWPTVCIGRVKAYQRTAQGTYNLVLAGLERAQIEYEIEPVRSFRRAKVKLVGRRFWKVDAASRELAEKLAAAIMKIEELQGRDVPLAALTDVVAFHLPLATDLKLKLLAEPDARVRAKLLLDNLPQVESRKNGNGPYPLDFSAN